MSTLSLLQLYRVHWGKFQMPKMGLNLHQNLGKRVSESLDFQN